jgi:site-specific DNA-methyltransferase (adenine-specific)
MKRSSPLAVHFSSNHVEWPTPPWLFEALDREFGFDLDPCATADNAKCRRFYTVADNWLLQDWGHSTVFMNPPYGRVIGEWVAKARRSAELGATVVCLLPARTDTRWWHEHVLKADDLRFFRGRLTFEGGQHPAPFPSVVVVFRPARPTLRSFELQP